MNHQQQQGILVELNITDLSNSGDGVGHLENGCVVFVSDTVTGDRALVRLVRVKQQYAYGKLQQILQPSPHRIRPRCIVADKCGGCQWQHIDDDYQRQAKRQQIIETLERIGGFSQPPVAPMLLGKAPLGKGQAPLKPVATDIPTISTLAYRNKVTYPLGLSAVGKVQAGYYRRGSHQLVNLNQCPVQDTRLNPLLAEIKQDIQQRCWSIYDEKQHQGHLRHLSLRIGRRTGEILLTLVTTDSNLENIQEQAEIWLKRYPSLVGVALNHNPRRGNVIFGEKTEIIAGQPYLREIFAGLELQLRPETFFQINTEAAEAVLEVIIDQLRLKGDERLVDAYCGIGTFSLPLAKRVQQVIGIEVNATSISQAQHNAQINQITNVTFTAGTVETILPQLDFEPDLVLLDPPRQGCDRTVIEWLKNWQPPRLVYISCQPATLARDLKLLCQAGGYHLTEVQPVDFFPQTSHVECVAFLQHESINSVI